MSAPASPETPRTGAAAPRAPALRGWLRWQPGVTALALAVLLAAAAAGMAWGLTALLAPLGEAAAPVGAAAGMTLLLLPLVLMLLKLARQLDRAQRLLARFDTLDTLTGVANRGHFLALAEREWARARRYGHGAGIVIVEVDRFRRLCEVRGPAAGDAVLRELVAVVNKGLRGADAMARYDQSQIVVLLAQADPTGALDVAERIRERAEQLDVPWQEQRIRITVSTGVATLRPAHTHLASLMQDAEAAVAAAREAGGNCVRAAPIDLHRAPSRGPSIGDNQAAGPNPGY